MELKKIDLAADPAPKTSTIPTPAPIPSPTSLPILKILGLVAALAVGLGAGYMLKNKSTVATRSDGAVIARNVPAAGLKEGDIIGLQDEKTFKDTVTGVLQKGGLDGEGSHKLLRPGGVSQTVYLTSSVIDLDQFVGAQVTVWGETFKGQKAGWLMDVGRVRVEKLNAPNPE